MLLWSVASFLSGSVPYAVLLTRIFRIDDARSVGDGNPGAVNAWKSGGWQVGLSVFLLDAAKAAIPVAFAHYVAGIGGWPIAIIGFMPILGHAYSPFLRFRGGKALASSISVWVVLGGWPVFVIGASVLILGKLVQRNDAWTIMATDFAVLVFLFAIGANPHLFGLWGAITVIVVAKHRKELLESPKIRYFAGDSARKNPLSDETENPTGVQR